MSTAIIRRPGLRAMGVLLAALMATSTIVTTAAPAQAQGRKTRQAIELAGQAREAFAEERYEDAASLLEQAYDLYPEPNFIWNIARAYELAGQDVLAESYYARFSQLGEVGETERTAALDRIARYAAARDIAAQLRSAQNQAEGQSLRRVNANLTTALADAQAAAATPKDGGGDMSLMALGGWTSAALGVVSLGAVLTLHMASIGTVEEYNDAAAAGDVPRYNALQDTLNTRVVTSRVLLGSGLALTALGGTLLYLEYFSEDEATPAEGGARIAPALGPDGVGVHITGSF